eukprot:TRINITY_DN15459_c0_g1_i1.p1 TRINITY_DN15459_c0_g1~~TRINITY_DN15459_c0_g1_i1.p1  ORF type:complete len:197 (-),score=38.10 TRINITY_DN15459_c0_g1_i1:120-710(-)
MHGEEPWASVSIGDLLSARCGCKTYATALQDVAFTRCAAKLLALAWKRCFLCQSCGRMECEECASSSMLTSDWEVSFRECSPALLRSIIQVLSANCDLESRKDAIATLGTVAAPVPPILIAVCACKLGDPGDRNSSIRHAAAAVLGNWGATALHVIAKLSSLGEHSEDFAAVASAIKKIGNDVNFCVNDLQGCLDP